MNSEAMTSMAPTVVSQRLMAFMVGNAMSRAPICSGTMMLPSPVRMGVAAKMIVREFPNREFEGVVSRAAGALGALPSREELKEAYEHTYTS